MHNIHQIPPICHIFDYDTTHQIFKCMQCFRLFSRCMWYHQDSGDNFTVNESTNVINITNYVLQKLCNKHHQLYSSELCNKHHQLHALEHHNITMNAQTSSKDSTMHNSPNYINVIIIPNYVFHQHLHYQILTSIQSTSHNSSSYKHQRNHHHNHHQQLTPQGNDKVSQPHFT